MIPEIEIKVSESRTLTEIGSIGFRFRDNGYCYLFIYLFIYLFVCFLFIYLFIYLLVFNLLSGVSLCFMLFNGGLDWWSSSQT